MGKKSIGCIIENIEGSYGRNVWLTLRKAAADANINLLVFEGRRLLAHGNDRRHNAIYALAERFRPDGWLLMGSAIGSYATPEAYHAFCARFAAHAPLVSIGISFPGHTSVLLDARPGMRRLMEHLIRTHGYRRIAFFKGPEGNAEARDRYRLFAAQMAAHRIPVDPALVFAGNFAGIDGYDAYQALYASRATCDAIVCANDDTALGAYHFVRALRRKGIQPPTERITGFDDARATRAHQPALTTIAQPIERMIERAIRILLSATPRQHPQKDIIFPTELIVRASCGCRYLGSSDLSDEMYMRPITPASIHQSMQNYTLQDLFAELERMLPQLGIRSCFIVRYEQAMAPPLAAQTVADQSELLFAYAGGLRRALPDPPLFATADLLPDPYLHEPQRVTDVIKPLFFHDEQFGYVVFEAQDDETYHFEALRGQIADSLMFALMMDRQKEIESELARLRAQMDAHNCVPDENEAGRCP